MSEKLVSVIIPTYGRPEYLKRAIKSVQEQTYSNIEIIVVDDNDPQCLYRKQTEKVMEEYIRQKNVFYLQHECNKNGSAARNTGLGIAKGEYVTFLDDDDEMRPERVELLYRKMESLDDSWCSCYSGFSKMKANGIIDRCGESRSGNLYIEALMRSLYFCPGSNIFARTKSVKGINGFDEDFPRNQDLEFLARLLENGKLANIPDDTLIIHYEDKNSGSKINYEKMVGIDTLFLSKFRIRIEKLSKKDQKRINQYFALERFRYSIRAHRITDGIKNCFDNRVSLWNFIRYNFYMIYRLITKKSVGFKI